jgi:hypothetical protein
MSYYERDLAVVHARGFGQHADRCAPASWSSCHRSAVYGTALSWSSAAAAGR